MYSFNRVRGWLIVVALLGAAALSSCSGGGADAEREVSSILTVGVQTGGGNGTTVEFNSDVELDRCWLTLVNGNTYEFDLNDAYSASVHVNPNPKLKFAKVLAKNGSDYWYFDRSGTYLNTGSAHPKVAVPGDY